MLANHNHHVGINHKAQDPIPTPCHTLVALNSKTLNPEPYTPNPELNASCCAVATAAAAAAAAKAAASRLASLR